MPEPTNDYHPWAEVYVAKSFKDEKLTPTAANTNLIAVEDISSLNVTLSADGKGTFSLVLDNKNDKYYYEDDLATETVNLWEASEEQRLLDKDWTQTSLKTEPGTYYPYRNVDDFLDSESAVVEDLSTSRRFLVFFRRSSRPGTSITTGEPHPYPVNYMWWFDDQENLYELTENQWNAEIFTGESGKEYTIRKFKNEEFYHKWGGNIRRGRCIFSPMDRVVIFLSRRFEVEGEGPLIRVFTGLVNKADDQYGETSSKVSISGDDVTKWLSISQVNVNPRLLQHEDLQKQKKPMLYTNRFAGWTGTQIIRALCLGREKAFPKGLPEGYEFESLMLDGVGSYQVDVRDSSLTEEGASGAVEIERQTKSISRTVTDKAAQDIFTSTKLILQDPSNYELDEFIPYQKFFSGDTWLGWQGEYETRYSLCQKVAEATNFKFYADSNGNIHYHQPRFSNAHILIAREPRVYIIDPMSIIGWTFVETDEELVTLLFATTEEDFIGSTKAEKAGRDMAYYQDNALVIKYGMRIYTVSDPLIRAAKGQPNPKVNPDVYYYAKSLIRRINADRLNGSVTITGRAEIVPDHPVYIPDRNMIYYVSSVQHSFEWENTFTTTLNLQYGRKPWDIMPELLTYQVDTVGTASDVVVQKARSLEGVRLLGNIDMLVIHHTGQSFRVPVSDLKAHEGSSEDVVSVPYDYVIGRAPRTIWCGPQWHHRDDLIQYNYTTLQSAPYAFFESFPKEHKIAYSSFPGNPERTLHVALHDNIVGAGFLGLVDFRGAFGSFLNSLADFILSLHLASNRHLKWDGVKFHGELESVNCPITSHWIPELRQALLEVIRSKITEGWSGITVTGMGLPFDRHVPDSFEAARLQTLRG